MILQVRSHDPTNSVIALKDNGVQKPISAGSVHEKLKRKMYGNQKKCHIHIHKIQRRLEDRAEPSKIKA